MALTFCCGGRRYVKSICSAFTLISHIADWNHDRHEQKKIWHTMKKTAIIWGVNNHAIDLWFQSQATFIAVCIFLYIHFYDILSRYIRNFGIVFSIFFSANKVTKHSKKSLSKRNEFFSSIFDAFVDKSFYCYFHWLSETVSPFSKINFKFTNVFLWLLYLIEITSIAETISLNWEEKRSFRE